MADITPTGTDIRISTDSAFSVSVLDESGAYKTIRSFVKGSLPYGVDLYAKVRHEHPLTGKTPWSPVIGFKIIIPANIIGVCLDNSGTSGVFYWIDALGNKLAAFDWTKHPIYMAITMATVDGARLPVTMTKIPLFYVKTAASGPVGSFADGKKCWWISDLAGFGFRPAACFKRSTSVGSDGNYVISPFCYMGTFVGHQETVGGVTCIGSKRGQTAAISQTKATLKTWISNRNNVAAGISGFRMFDIWDMSALRLLLLIATLNPDTQSAWGDNSAAVVSPKTGSTNARAVFKGTHADPQISIEDLWRCYWYHTDLISVSNGVVSLTSPMDLSSALGFGAAAVARYTQTTTTGWLRDVLDCPVIIGNDTHDLLELFLPKLTTSNASQATFPDAFFLNGGDALAGGAFGYDETYQSYEQTGSTSTLLANTNPTSCGSYEWRSGGCTRFIAGSGDGSTWYENCSASICNQYTTSPVYGYVTRTRTKTYTTEPGIFCTSLGVPTPASNAAMVAARISKN